jgi:hypothetical protein
VALDAAMRRAGANYLALDRYGEQVGLANLLRSSPCFASLSADGVNPAGVEVFRRRGCPDTNRKS